MTEVMSPGALATRARVVEALCLGLGFETIEVRNSDALDFREVSVSAVVAALRVAWSSGFAEGYRGTANV